MVSLGSRAVEEVILGTKMTGAAVDLMSATRPGNGVLRRSRDGLLAPRRAAARMTSPAYPLPVARMADVAARHC